MQDAPPIAVALARTRAVGALLDVSTGLLAGVGLGHALGHGRAGAALGTLAGLGCALRWGQMRAARTLQRAQPRLGTALEAYLEGGGGTLRPKLEAWVVQRLAPAWPWAALARLALAVGVALVAYAVPRRGPVDIGLGVVDAAAVLDVTARLQPPAYTGWPSAPVELPHVRALRHSQLQLQLRTSAGRLSWAESSGDVHALSPVHGLATLTLPVEASGSVRLSTQGPGPVVVLEVEAVPDAPPQVTLDAPATDSTVHSAPGRLLLRASAEDDVRVARLAFRWTLAHGHGEGMRFGNGTLVPRVRWEGRRAEAAASLDTAALGMKAGDTLVVWAEATDGNTADGPGQGRSEARVVRWEETLVDVSTPGAGARLPPPAAEPTERQLLARTQRLVHSPARGAARRAESTQLADVQRHIREAFGFFLQQESKTGLELDVDEAEVAQSGEARGRKLLAQAVSGMWTAEAALAMGRPADALAPETAAVQALEAAFGSERLALRPLRPADKPVDERRRLSGAQSQLRPAALAGPAPRRPDAAGVESLAQRLLLSSERPLSAEAARQLADALWGLGVSGIPAPSLAAPLYAAGDEASRAAAARAAGVALSRWLRPSPDVIPPVSPDEASVLARLPLLPPQP